jgi:hypothetical protein
MYNIFTFYSYLNYIKNPINYGGQQFLVKMFNYLNMTNALHIYFYLYLCKESHELWRNNLTKSNTMWMDYNQINLWVVMGGIL